MTVGTFAQTLETAQQKQMAEQMAKYMDDAWEASPPDGMANLRVLMVKDGKLYAGTTSIYGKFNFKAAGNKTHLTAFNPNAKGRWVMEEMDAGTYDISIEGKEDMEGIKWEKTGYVLKAGEAPIIEIDLSDK